MNDDLSSYAAVERKFPMHSSKYYNNNRISIYYRSWIRVNERQKQGQLNSNKKVSVKNNGYEEACIESIESLEIVYSSTKSNCNFI